MPYPTTSHRLFYTCIYKYIQIFVLSIIQTVIRSYIDISKSIFIIHTDTYIHTNINTYIHKCAYNQSFSQRFRRFIHLNTFSFPIIFTYMYFKYVHACIHTYVPVLLAYSARGVWGSLGMGCLSVCPCVANLRLSVCLCVPVVGGTERPSSRCRQWPW
jgi:hypothetical protein